MEKLRRAVQNFMRGRNGIDEFCAVVFIAGAFIYVLHFITGDRIWYNIYIVCLVYALFRMCSTNLPARRAENKLIVGLVQLQKMRWQVRKTHKVYLCKGCGRLVRVPKGKGKIEVTCPVCGQKKIINT